MRKILFFTLSLLLCLSSGAQKKDVLYPVLKQLKDADLQKEISPLANKKGLWGFADEKGKFVIKPVFDEVQPFQNGPETASMTLAKVVTGGKEGFLRRDALYLIPPVYDALSDFTESIAYFTKDGHKGFLDTSGNVLFQDADEIKPFKSKDHAWFCSGGLWGAVNKVGEVVVLPEFSSEPSELDAKMYQVEANGKRGLLYKEGLTALLPCKYDDIVIDKVRWLIYAREDGLYGIYRMDGTQILDHVLREKPIFEQNVFKFYLDGRPGLIRDGGLVTDIFAYEESLRYKGEEAYRTDSVLPGCFKDPYYCYRDDENRRNAYWKKEHQFIPRKSEPGSSLKIYHSPFRVSQSYSEAGVSPEPLGGVILGREKEVLNMEGQIEAGGSSVGTVSVNLEYGTQFPFGTALSSLYQTINSSKVNAYDQANGTDLLRSWEGLGFAIYGGFASGNNRFFAVNMFILRHGDGHFVQRWYLLLDSEGKVVTKWNVGGNVHNPSHPALPYEFNMFCPDSEAIFVMETEKPYDPESGAAIYTTTRYSAHGTAIGSYSGLFLPSSIIPWNDQYLVFGAGPLGDAYEGSSGRLGGSMTVLFSRDGNAQEVGWVPDIRDWQFPERMFPFGEGALGFNDSEGVFWGFLMEPGRVSLPALRYWEDSWAGKPLYSFAQNSSRAVGWTVFGEKPSVGPLLDRHLEGFKILTDEPDEDGYYRYFYAPYGKDLGKFGYFGHGIMTQAVFDRAEPFSGGRAEVVIGGKTRRVTEAQLRYWSGR